VCLPDEVVEGLRAVFSRENLVAHAPNLVRRRWSENRNSRSWIGFTGLKDL
jgi:hypothetical protein